MKCGYFSFNREALWTQNIKPLFYKIYIIILIVVNFKKPHIHELNIGYRKKRHRIMLGEKYFKYSTYPQQNFTMGYFFIQFFFLIKGFSLCLLKYFLVELYM